MEEREDEDTADFGAIFHRDTDFGPGLRVNGPVPRDF